MSGFDETTVAAPAGTQVALPPEMRERLVQQFEQWVDRMLAGEPPPEGLPQELLDEVATVNPLGAESAEENCDLYTLYTGLTVLSGEIRLQGRAFKQLSNNLAPLSELDEQLQRLERLSDQRAAAADDLPASSKEICESMLDLYDRLQRGLQTCDYGIASLGKRNSGWARRMLGMARSAEVSIQSTQAIRDTTAMTLARLESVLHDWGVERIGRIGEKFDPTRMAVVQVRSDSRAEPATVLEVNRSGYALKGQLKVTAQVTVAHGEEVPGSI